MMHLISGDVTTSPIYIKHTERTPVRWAHEKGARIREGWSATPPRRGWLEAARQFGDAGGQRRHARLFDGHRRAASQAGRGLLEAPPHEGVVELPLSLRHGVDDLAQPVANRRSRRFAAVKVDWRLGPILLVPVCHGVLSRYVQLK